MTRPDRKAHAGGEPAPPGPGREAPPREAPGGAGAEGTSGRRARPKPSVNPSSHALFRDALRGVLGLDPIEATTTTAGAAKARQRATERRS